MKVIDGKFVGFSKAIDEEERERNDFEFWVERKLRMDSLEKLHSFIRFYFELNEFEIFVVCWNDLTNFKNIISVNNYLNHIF